MAADELLSVDDRLAPKYEIFFLNNLSDLVNILVYHVFSFLNAFLNRKFLLLRTRDVCVEDYLVNGFLLLLRGELHFSLRLSQR